MKLARPHPDTTCAPARPGFEQGADRDQHRPALAKASPAAPVARRRGRVLVVDDEHIIGKVVSRALSREHDVTVLTSAGDALKLLAEGRRFDVILCDLLMPQMTGMQLHAELSRALPDQAARMIFLTGGAFGTQERAFLEGGAAVLEKPFETRQLQSLVNARIV